MFPRQPRPLVHTRIATGREVFVRRVLVLAGAASVTIACRLILIRPSLILVARSLITVRQRLLIRPSDIIDADDTGTAAGRACRQLVHIPLSAYPQRVRPDSQRVRTCTRRSIRSMTERSRRTPLHEFETMRPSLSLMLR